MTSRPSARPGSSSERSGTRNEWKGNRGCSTAARQEAGLTTGILQLLHGRIGTAPALITLMRTPTRLATSLRLRSAMTTGTTGGEGSECPAHASTMARGNWSSLFPGPTALPPTHAAACHRPPARSPKVCLPAAARPARDVSARTSPLVPILGSDGLPGSCLSATRFAGHLYEL